MHLSLCPSISKGWYLALFLGSSVECLLALPLFASPTQKEWTVLVYMNADNDLSSHAIADLNEMEEVGSSKEVDIVVQLDTRGNKGITRYHVQKDRVPSLTSPVLSQLPEQDSSASETLMEFLLYGVENFPSKHYFLIIWSHGRGYMGGISYDESAGKWMSIAGLRAALSFMQDAYLVGKRIDVYGADACFMQSLEVLYQLRGQAKYYIGSANREKKTGWAYQHVLRYLVADPYQTLRHKQGGAGADAVYWLAVEVPHLYLREYYEKDNYATLNTVAGREIARSDRQSFFASLTRLSAQLRAYILANPFLHKAKYLTAAQNAYQYAPANRDFKSFLLHLRNLTPKSLHPSLDDTLASLRQLTVRPLAEDKVDYRIYYSKELGYGTLASGLTLWLPTSQEQFNATKDAFKDTDLLKNSGWYDLQRVLF